MLEQTLNSIASSLVTLTEIQSEMLNLMREQANQPTVTGDTAGSVVEPQVTLPADAERQTQPVDESEPPLTDQDIANAETWISQMEAYLGGNQQILAVFQQNGINSLHEVGGSRQLLNKLLADIQVLTPQQGAAA